MGGGNTDNDNVIADDPFAKEVPASGRVRCCDSNAHSVHTVVSRRPKDGDLLCMGRGVATCLVRSHSSFSQMALRVGGIKSVRAEAFWISIAIFTTFSRITNLAKDEVCLGFGVGKN